MAIKGWCMLEGKRELNSHLRFAHPGGWCITKELISSLAGHKPINGLHIKCMEDSTP